MLKAESPIEVRAAGRHGVKFVRPEQLEKHSWPIDWSVSPTLTRLRAETP